jgi:hypothetical protein
MEQMKKPYVKPELKLHGSVESITGFTGEHDVFGGGFLSTAARCKQKDHSPAHANS